MDLSDVKKAMVTKQPVTHNDIEYSHISACILKFDGKEFYYSLELYDKNGRSVATARMDKVMLNEQRV